MLHGTVDRYLIQLGREAVTQAIAQPCHAAAFLRHFLLRNFTSLAEANNARDIESSGAEPAFMAAAIDHGNQPRGRVTPDIQRSAAFRTVKLMRRERSQVKIGAVNVQRSLAQGLDGIRVEEHTTFAAEPPDLFNGLKHAGFIVGRHDAYQDRLVREGLLELIKIDEAIAPHRQIRYTEAALFQMFAGIEHGLVLGNNCDDVVAFSVTRFRHAFDGQVVALRGTGGKDDLRRRRANGSCNLAAGFLHGAGCLPAKGVAAAGSVAKTRG